MGRKKKYDRDTLLTRSMANFRQHGYASTSTQMLVNDLQVNRFSLYAEFGNKQGLFEAALERYNNDVIRPKFEPLFAETAGFDEIRELIEFYGAAGETQASGRGCLLCNTAVEFGPTDPSEANLIPQYFDYLSGAFKAALTNAHRRAETPKSVDLKAEADFFTACVLGMFVMIRAEAPKSMLRNAAKAAIQHLELLRG